MTGDSLSGLSSKSEGVSVLSVFAFCPLFLSKGAIIMALEGAISHGK